MNTADNERPSKAEWRTRLLDERGAITEELHTAEAEAIAKSACAPPISQPGHTVCCYVPSGSEPGSMSLLDALVEAGARVLLPIIPPGSGALDQRGPLDWAEYTGPASLHEGRMRSIMEPAGEPLGPAAIGQANVVLVPALAVDEFGVRIGKGGGYYDRSLTQTAPGTQLIAVVRDGELVNRLPTEAHDVRMTGALTPGHGYLALPRS